MRIRVTRCRLLVILLSGLAGLAGLASLAGTARHVMAQQRIDPSYTLSPGDVIEVTVLNHNDLDKTLTVLPDGRVAFGPVGELMAAGKTPRALAAELRTVLDKTLNNFNVTVAVKELRPRKVRVIGAVKAPGSFDFKDGTRFLDVVAAAGGLTNSKPERIKGRIVRVGPNASPTAVPTVITLNVDAAVARPNTDANTQLEIDDLVMLEEPDLPKQQVFVLGQVAKPGTFDFDASTSVLSLLTLAGSGTEKASYTKAAIVRGGKEIPLNLLGAVVQGKPDPAVTDYKLQPGDVLFIPENMTHVAVMGDVIRPGFYQLPEDRPMTVLDALNLAGIQSQGADPGKSGVIRVKDGKPTFIPINVDKLLKKADLSKNLTLQKDDVVYVPHKGKTLSVNDIYLPVAILNYMGLRLFR